MEEDMAAKRVVWWNRYGTWTQTCRVSEGASFPSGASRRETIYVDCCAGGERAHGAAHNPLCFAYDNALRAYHLLCQIIDKDRQIGFGIGKHLLAGRRVVVEVVRTRQCALDAVRCGWIVGLIFVRAS
jgi:hypothetical protein